MTYCGYGTQRRMEKAIASASAQIRLIIHGWSFAGGSAIRNRLTRAEAELVNVPANLRDAIDREYLQPLRDAIGERK